MRGTQGVEARQAVWSNPHVRPDQARRLMNTPRRVLTLSLQVLLFTSCGARGQGPTVALDCDDLGIEVPAEIPPSNDGRSPVLLNEDTVNAAARSLYRVPWLRMARLKVFVQTDGKVSHACLSGASLDSAFNRIALKTSELARFRPAGGARPVAAWTTLLVVAAARSLPATRGRYLPIAFPDTLELRFESTRVLGLQAAVLNYLITHNNAHDRRGPNRGICVGVGPILRVFDPPSSLMASLLPTSLPLHAASECEVDRQYTQDGPSRLVLRSDGTPAIAVWVDIAEPHDGVAQVRAGYYEGGMSGADYSCRVRVVNGQWTVDTCRVTAIS